MVTRSWLRWCRDPKIRKEIRQSKLREMCHQSARCFSFALTGSHPYADHCFAIAIVFPRSSTFEFLTVPGLRSRRIPTRPQSIQASTNNSPTGIWQDPTLRYSRWKTSRIAGPETSRGDFFVSSSTFKAEQRLPWSGVSGHKAKNWPNRRCAQILWGLAHHSRSTSRWNSWICGSRFRCSSYTGTVLAGVSMSNEDRRSPPCSLSFTAIIRASNSPALVLFSSPPLAAGCCIKARSWPWPAFAARATVQHFSHRSFWSQGLSNVSDFYRNYQAPPARQLRH